MTVIEARDALSLALEDISKKAVEKGLTADIKCFIADHDLIELTPDDISKAALISGEISVGTEKSEEKLILECALSITDGDVSPEEMLREVNVMRDSMNELCEKLDETGNAEDAFTAVSPEERIPEVPRTYDNKRFYIACSIGAAALIVLILIIGALF